MFEHTLESSSKEPEVDDPRGAEGEIKVIHDDGVPMLYWSLLLFNQKGDESCVVG